MLREWLRVLRKTQNLTLAEVAEAAGVNVTEISKYERGERKPRPEVAKKIAELLGFDWTRFYE